MARVAMQAGMAVARGGRGGIGAIVAGSPWRGWPYSVARESRCNAPRLLSDFPHFSTNVIEMPRC